MKNLPEKIYLNLNMTPQEIVETKDQDFHEAIKTWEIPWSEECLSEHDPEYVHKDAFIEKVCEYLMEYEFNDSPTIADRRKHVEDFEKYMEG